MKLTIPASVALTPAVRYVESKWQRVARWHAVPVDMKVELSIN